VDLNIAATKSTAFRRTTINRNDEGVGPRRLIIILHRHVENARRTVVGTRATECGCIAGNRKGSEHHAMYLCTARVVHILQVAVYRVICRLSLHYEAEVPNASANIDGATAGHLAHCGRRGHHDSYDLRHDDVSAALIGSLERDRGRREIDRLRVPRHVSVAQGVHGYALARVLVCPTEVSGVDKRCGPKGI
jgi:hypothetical protein